MNGMSSVPASLPARVKDEREERHNVAMDDQKMAEQLLEQSEVLLRLGLASFQQLDDMADDFLRPVDGYTFRCSRPRCHGVRSICRLAETRV